MFEPVNEPRDWTAFRASVLDEPLICFGMTVRDASREDADAVAALLGDPPARTGGAKGAPAVGNLTLARHLIRQGTVLVVEDDERRPMGLVSLRRVHHGRVEAGWRLDEARLGKGLAAILVEGVTERLFRSGAGIVGCPVHPTARGARRTLETLGFGLVSPDGRPLAYEADAAMFASRTRRGTALLPTPAERRRGASTGEQGIVDGNDRDPWRIADGVVRGAFRTPITRDDLGLARADRYALDDLVPVVPDPPVQGEITHGIKRLALEAALERGTLVVAESGGEPFGTLTVRAHPDGRIDLGWFVRPDRRGEGLAARMAAFAAGRLFAAGAERITCGVERGNPASARVAKRIGFAPMGGGRHLSFSLLPGQLVTPEPASTAPMP